jgi:hypothetical protein
MAVAAAATVGVAGAVTVEVSAVFSGGDFLILGPAALIFADLESPALAVGAGTWGLARNRLIERKNCTPGLVLKSYVSAFALAGNANRSDNFRYLEWFGSI